MVNYFFTGISLLTLAVTPLCAQNARVQGIPARQAVNVNVNARPQTGTEARVLPITQARQIPPNVIVGERCQERRPLPITVKLDRRCIPCNVITSHPFAIKPKGNLIELVDGSIWHIKHKRDRRLVKQWNMRDDIIVENVPGTRWKTYRLTNYSKGESVEAALSLGNKYEGKAARWVVRIDGVRGIVELNDGSLWSVTETPSDDWRENDPVILGLSKNIGGSSLYMMINTRTMRHVSAITFR